MHLLMQHLRWTLAMNSSEFTKKNRWISGPNSLPGNVYRYQLLANSVDDATTKLTSPTSKTWTLPAPTMRRLYLTQTFWKLWLIYHQKNQWTEHLVEYLVKSLTGFVGVLNFLESPWILKFVFKAWKLLEFSCFCYNVLESPWKREKHRMFLKRIVLNYVKLLNFRHWWCSDYCRQRTVFVTPKTEHSGIGARFIH